jgi:hypothetical protein
LVGGLLSFASSLSAAAKPKARLYSQTAEHLEVIYYDPAHEYLVAHLIRAFENTLRFQRGLFRYTPSGKVTIFLEDLEDYGSGGADAIPFNFIRIGIAPFSYAYETIPANERITWTINHEMVHVVANDSFATVDRRFRSLFFGKPAVTPEDPPSMVYSAMATPRQYSPRWYNEGLAAFLETWMAGGLGRALGGYDEMVFRAMVRDDAYIYNLVGLESEGTAIDFQTGVNAYLYGTRFMTWLSRTRGPEKMLEWVRRSDGGKRFFGSRYKEVYGEDLEEGWKKWIAAEREWQQRNLETIRKYPVTKPERLSSKVIGSVSRGFYDESDKVIYAAVRYAGQMGHLAAIHTDTGEVDHLKDIKGSAMYYVTSLAYDSDGRRIFYATDNNQWRDINIYDLKTRRSTMVFRNARAGDLAYNRKDKSLWAVEHSNGLSKLTMMRPPYHTGSIIYTFNFGRDLYEIDISPDGRYLTGALTDMTGKQQLVRFEIARLLAGENGFEELHDFEYNSPGNFVHSPDGRYLYGSSYYTGASNLFRYDTETRKMDVISNAETGLFRPIPLADGSLIAFEYSSKGFVPGRVPTKALEDVNAVPYLGMDLLEKYPVLKTWKLPPASTVDTEKFLTGKGYYSPLHSMQRASMYPIVQGYKSSPAAGLRFDIADRLRLASTSATLSYSPDTALKMSERVHFGFASRWWDWRLSGYYNYADFYDLFGPTKVSRKGYSLQLGQVKTLLWDLPRTVELQWNIAGYGGMERLPDYQNVATSYRSFLAGNFGLKYSFLEKSQGAVEDEKGTEFGVYSRLNYASSDAFPRVWANYNRGWLLPIHNSSVWVRGSAGKSFGDQSSPFANFYFGGFGNNWVDRFATSRYREYYSFPGVGLNEIAANSYGKILTEWNLPPLRFKSLGTTWMYCNWARLTLFSSGLFTNLNRAPERQYFANLGSQLDFRIVLFTYMNSTFSAGYAAAADREGRVSTEYMISLKLL